LEHDVTQQNAFGTPALAGVFTALVTPMAPDGAIDWPALDRLVDAQIEAGVAGLCACGTTGEAATLTAEEREAVVARVVRQARGRVRIMAGTGSNATQATIAAQARAQALGADYGLVVTPYYNRPSQQGLLAHYRAIAAACSLPMVLYNVPSRTGCDMLPQTIAQLAELPQVVGVKEATGDLGRLDYLRSVVPAEFALLGGDDPSTCAFMLTGGHGIISVASNCVPAAMVELAAQAQRADVAAARAQQDRLLPLFTALGAETNPVPIKSAMALAGQLTEALRLPLLPATTQTRARLREVLAAGGWLGGAST
jgi:4-hydroxy-tetrahydrodipicolinate synthase